MTKSQPTIEILARINKNSNANKDEVCKVAMYGLGSNSIEKRLKAKICELCGDTEALHYEIHHVNKLRNLKGKEAWEKAMIARQRKTLVLCRDCHHKIHNQ